MPRFDAASPPLSEYAQRAAQTHRENLMRERGERRAKKAIAQALERGEAADTPAGVQLARRAVVAYTSFATFCIGPRQKSAGGNVDPANSAAWAKPERTPAADGGRARSAVVRIIATPPSLIRQ